MTLSRAGRLASGWSAAFEGDEVSSKGRLVDPVGCGDADILAVRGFGVKFFHAADEVVRRRFGSVNQLIEFLDSYLHLGVFERKRAGVVAGEGSEARVYLWDGGRTAGARGFDDMTRLDRELRCSEWW